MYLQNITAICEFLSLGLFALAILSPNMSCNFCDNFIVIVNSRKFTVISYKRFKWQLQQFGLKLQACLDFYCDKPGTNLQFFLLVILAKGPNMQFCHDTAVNLQVVYTRSFNSSGNKIIIANCKYLIWIIGYHIWLLQKPLKRLRRHQQGNRHYMFSSDDADDHDVDIINFPRLKIMSTLSNFLRSVIALSPNDLLPCVYLCLNKVSSHWIILLLLLG